MITHADKTQENKSQPAANSLTKPPGNEEPAFQLVDNRPEAIAQRKLQEGINNSPRVQQFKARQEMANNSAPVKQFMAYQAMANNFTSQTAQRKENLEEETLQGKFETIQKKENNTGLPYNLKSGIENLSGYSMDDVKVHYNSEKPAQLQAHAYAQGTDIHIASGQEKHLPHEAWHVVQQKQGRVTPTMQMKGKVNVNDDAGLEREADVMGGKALGAGAVQMHRPGNVGLLEMTPSPTESSPIQPRWINNGKMLMWESLIEGAQWFYEPDSKLMYYYRDGETSEKKLREVWVKEYGSDPLALEDPSVTAGMTGDQVKPEHVGPAGDLMGYLNDRYVTKVYWDSKSGKDDEKDKLVIIESYVRKDDGGLESVYKNEMNIRTNTFYAANNQRETDTKVGTTKSKAMFNSDLLTCHRHMAIEFASRQGVEMIGDGSSFTIVRKNVNNGAWQEIYTGIGNIPIRVRGILTNTEVTESEPVALGKTLNYGGKEATTMMEIFKTMVPNTKAVYQMIKDRYPGYSVASWRYLDGCLIARVVRN